MLHCDQVIYCSTLYVLEVLGFARGYSSLSGLRVLINYHSCDGIKKGITTNSTDSCAIEYQVSQFSFCSCSLRRECSLRKPIRIHNLFLLSSRRFFFWFSYWHFQEILWIVSNQKNLPREIVRAAPPWFWVPSYRRSSIFRRMVLGLQTKAWQSSLLLD